MHDNPIVARLIRILRAETADHPLIAKAVLANTAIIAETNYSDQHKLTRTAARLADAIEDWVGFEGESLGRYIREPWLSRWRETCAWALRKAHNEAMQSSEAV